MELQKFETVKRWLNGLRQSQTGSSSTEKNYLRWFNEFIEWSGKTPDQLIAERKQELKNEDEAVKRKAEAFA